LPTFRKNQIEILERSKNIWIDCVADLDNPVLEPIGAPFTEFDGSEW